MFRLRNILWLGFLSLALFSCEDYLDTPPVDTLGTENFYKTAAQSEQAIVGIYADLRDVHNETYLYMSECRSDNAWTNPRPDGLRDYAEIGAFRANDELATFNDAWNTWYKLIYDANVALSKIPGCTFNDEKVKQQFINEAHFLRGWAYFELARLFGNIPMVVQPVSPAEIKTIGQSSAREIIDQVVIPDLKEALNLPYTEKMLDSNGNSISTQGRADKMAATAMLARVYMTLTGFPYNDNSAKSEAKKYLQEVLDYSKSNGDKFWAPTLDEWRKQWIPSTDYYNKYSIFAIQYRAGGSGNPALFNYTAQLPPSYTDQRFFSNQIYVEKSLEYEFERTFSNGQKDGRGEGFSTLIGFEKEGNTQAYTNDKDFVTVDGQNVEVYTKTMIYKYLPTKRKIAALGMSLNPEENMLDYNDWPVNYPVLRLEDMMLLYAELLADEGNITEAMSYVNKIRERAGCDPETASSKDEALKYIKRERRIELMGEGIRWFDQIRYGTWKQDICDMFDRYHNPDGMDKANVKDGYYLYPIPLNQINVTPGLYKQNADY